MLESGVVFTISAKYHPISPDELATLLSFPY